MQLQRGKRESSKQPKMKRLLVQMIFTAMSVGSALWHGQRLMADTVHAQYLNTPHMEAALKRLEHEQTHKAKVKAQLDKRRQSNSKHQTKLQKQKKKPANQPAQPASHLRKTI